MHFCASSNRFRNINVSNEWHFKKIARSRSTIFAMLASDGKCQNLPKFMRQLNYFRDNNVLLSLRYGPW